MTGKGPDPAAVRVTDRMWAVTEFPSLRAVSVTEFPSPCVR